MARRDREDIGAPRIVAGTGTEGTTRHGGYGPGAGCFLLGQLYRFLGPNRPASGIDLHRYRHIPVHFLTRRRQAIPDARRYRDVAQELPVGDTFCAH